MKEHEINCESEFGTEERVRRATKCLRVMALHPSGSVFNPDSDLCREGKLKQHLHKSCPH